MWVGLLHLNRFPDQGEFEFQLIFFRHAHGLHNQEEAVWEKTLGEENFLERLLLLL
jgi:hypothetical protein